MTDPTPTEAVEEMRRRLKERDTRVASTRPTITVVHQRNTIEGTPDEHYTVRRIVNSLDYYPGDILSRTDVERIYAEGGWELIVE